MNLDVYTQHIPLTQKARFWGNFVSALKGFIKLKISEDIKEYWQGLTICTLPPSRTFATTTPPLWRQCQELMQDWRMSSEGWKIWCGEEDEEHLFHRLLSWLKQMTGETKTHKLFLRWSCSKYFSGSTLLDTIIVLSTQKFTALTETETKELFVFKLFSHNSQHPISTREL